MPPPIPFVRAVTDVTRRAARVLRRDFATVGLLKPRFPLLRTAARTPKLNGTLRLRSAFFVF
jgi:hypothetical protein